MSPTTTDDPGLAPSGAGSTSDTSNGAGTPSASSPPTTQTLQAPRTPQSPGSRPHLPASSESTAGTTAVVIEPPTSWAAIPWRELWSYRELGYFLTWRDIKIRYKQSVLGAAWAIIQPLMVMLIFTALLGRHSNLAQSSGELPFPISTYAGLVAYTFFSAAVTNSGNSLVGSAHLISKVYFPRMLVPAAAVGAAMVDFAIAAAFGLPLSFFYGRPPTLGPGLLMLPVLVVLLTLLGLGVGMWMSALNVKYRDIRYALPFLVQIGMFASPVFFRYQPEKGLPWLALNPMTGILEGFRSALFGLPFHWGALGASALITALLMVYALFAFRRMEASFADVI